MELKNYKEYSLQDYYKITRKLLVYMNLKEYIYSEYFEELVSACIRGHLAYDSNKPASLQTYVIRCIRNQVYKIYKQKAKNISPVQDRVVENNDIKILEDKDLLYSLISSLHLAEAEKRILDMYLSSGYNITRIAKELGYCKQYVSSTMKHITNELRIIYENRNKRQGGDYVRR